MTFTFTAAFLMAATAICLSQSSPEADGCDCTGTLAGVAVCGTDGISYSDICALKKAQKINLSLGRRCVGNCPCGDKKPDHCDAEVTDFSKGYKMEHFFNKSTNETVEMIGVEHAMYGDNHMKRCFLFNMLLSGRGRGFSRPGGSGFPGLNFPGRNRPRPGRPSAPKPSKPIQPGPGGGGVQEEGAGGLGAGDGSDGAAPGSADADSGSDAAGSPGIEAGSTPEEEAEASSGTGSGLSGSGPGGFVVPPQSSDSHGEPSSGGTDEVAENTNGENDPKSGRASVVKGEKVDGSRSPNPSVHPNGKPQKHLPSNEIHAQNSNKQPSKPSVPAFHGNRPAVGKPSQSGKRIAHSNRLAGSHGPDPDGPVCLVSSAGKLETVNNMITAHCKTFSSVGTALGVRCLGRCEDCAGVIGCRKFEAEQS